MRKLHRNIARGSSVLEAAVTILALSAFLTAVAAVVDLMGRNFRLTRLVDWVVTDQGVRPLRLQNDPYGVGASVVVDHPKMHQYLEAVRARVSQQLNGQDYALDSRYAVLNINEQNGQVTSLDASSAYRITDGSGTIPEDISSCPDLSVSFNDLALRQRTENGAQVSEFAYPNGAGSGYLKQVVLLGTRLYQDLGDSYTGSVMEELGLTPGVYGCKTAVLRGDFE